MSEEPLSPDSAPEKPAAKKAARRVSTPRPKKTAKEAGKSKPAAESPVEAPAPANEPPATPANEPVVAKLPIEPPFPSDAPSSKEAASPSLADERRDHERQERLQREDSHSEGSRRSDDGGQRSHWPEPETIQGGEGGTGNKRKRRRKKKGGQGGQASQGQGIPQQGESHAPRHPQGAQPPVSQSSEPTPRVSPPAQAPRVPIDGEALSKKAWKIFLAEVSEEGLALIGDQDARELSRRSFRLAEIFLEEQGRRLR